MFTFLLATTRLLCGLPPYDRSVRFAKTVRTSLSQAILDLHVHFQNPQKTKMSLTPRQCQQKGCYINCWSISCWCHIDSVWNPEHSFPLWTEERGVSGQSRGLQISLSPCVEAVCQNKSLCQTRSMEGFDRRHCLFWGANTTHALHWQMACCFLWLWTAVFPLATRDSTTALVSYRASWRFCSFLVPLCPSAWDLFTVKTISSLLAKKAFSLAAMVRIADAYSSFKLFIFYFRSPQIPQISLPSGRAKDIFENLSVSVRKTKKFCFKAVILNLWVAAPWHIRYLDCDS